MNKTNFQFNPKSGTMEPVNPIRHELEKSKPEFVKEAPKPQPRLNGAKDMVSEQQVKSNVQDNDQIVKFRVMADRDVINIMDDKTGEILCCISGYAMHWAFNFRELRSVQRIEQCLDGITKLFRHKITEEMAKTMNK